MHAPSVTAIIIIVVLALVLFAAPKLPKIARSMGQSMRIFKSEMKQMKEDDAPKDKAASDPEAPVEGRIVDDGREGPRA